MTTTAPKDLKGQQIGRYTLLEHLASGGMAEIFLARHEADGGFCKDLVLKILQSRYSDQEDVARMFLDEARLGAKLNHPNIVDVYDVGQEKGMRFIAMEHISGKTLTEVVRRGIEIGKPLSLDHAAYLAAETAAGLAYMHDGSDGRRRPFRIIHRDISPSNLIVSFSGQTKIIDFGIAREGDAPELSGARPGKVSYMSPEQVQGHKLDGRSDIFSLGTILYEITLGKRLWRGAKEVVMKRIVEEKPPPPTYVNRAYPPALELIVMRALEKRPENRYPSAGELFEELEAYLISSGARTRNHQIAQYLHDLFAADAELSEVGVRRARAFDDEDEGDDDDLDFDRPTTGAGKALADALRSSNPFAPAAAREELEPRAAVGDAGAIPVPRHRSVPAPSPLTLSDAPVPRKLTGPVAPPPAPLVVPPAPKRMRMGLLVGLVLASAAAVGLLLAFAHG
jgi:serine/threonine protein kinase